MSYKPRFFEANELLPSGVFEALGERGLQLIPSFALRGLDGLRRLHNNPITINNWARGGVLQYRGLRPLDCPIGAKQSKHKLGIAFDITTQHMLSLVDLIAAAGPALGIARLEDSSVTLPKNYLHIEFSEHPTDEVVRFYP